MSDFEVCKVFSLFVANLGGNLQAQRRTMFAGQRLVVHLITEQRLRVRGRGHIQGFVIIVRALNSYKARGWIGANCLEEIGEPGTTKPANYVPTLYANVARVLPDFG